MNPFGIRSFQRVLAACTVALLAGAGLAQGVTVLTHESFALPEALVEAFEEEHGVQVDVVAGGDAGEIVNRALLTRERPLADVLFGIDDALIAREGARDLFAPYVSPAREHVPEEYVFAGDLLTPVDVGYVLLNYHPDGLEARGAPEPEDLTDLTEPAFEDLTVVTDPASSSPGMAFLLTTVVRFGEGGDYDWLDYWADLRDNGLQVTAGWSDAYNTSFTPYGGDRPIVLSYATSPAAEAMFAEEAPDEPITENLHCRECAWRQIEAAGVLEGTDAPEASRAFVDFLLSEPVQEAIPTSMFVHPVRPDVPLPDAYERFATLPDEEGIARMDAERIEANGERWLDQWTRVVRQDRDPAEVR